VVNGSTKACLGTPPRLNSSSKARQMIRDDLEQVGVNLEQLGESHLQVGVVKD